MNNIKFKHMICKNYLFDGDCPFKDYCKYAHNIKEQQIVPIRKYVYDLIDTNTIDEKTLSDAEVYNELMILTKPCYNCQANQCPGGYNCRNGSYSNKYLICRDNLLGIFCANTDCKKKHIRKINPLPLRQVTKLDDLKCTLESNITIVKDKAKVDTSDNLDNSHLRESDLDNSDDYFNEDELRYLESFSDDDIYRTIFD